MNYFKKVESMLNDYGRTKAEIKNIHIEIEEVKNDYTGCGSISYEERPAPTNSFNSRVENETIAKDMKLEQLNRLLRQKELQIEKIDNALGLLDEDAAQLIKLRYFDKLPFRLIGDRMNRNYNSCERSKKDIVNKLTEIIFILQ